MATNAKLAQELNWTNSKASIKGTYKGFLVTLYQRRNYMNNADNYRELYIPVDNLTTENSNEIQQFVMTNKKDLRVLKCSFGNDLVTLRLNEIFKTFSSTMLLDLLDKLLSNFDRLGITARTTCEFCHREETDTVVKINEVYFPAHQTCVAETKQEMVESLEEYNQQENNYGKGIVGAVIGAVIGTIPWFIIEVFVGFYAGVLAFLIGYLAYFFYKKLGGKVTNVTKYIITIITFLAIILTNLEVASYVILASDAPLMLENYIIVYTDPTIAPLMFQSLGLGMFIGIFGLISVFKKVKSEEVGIAIE